MIIHNIEQNSDEWHKVRLGKFTGSDFHTCRLSGRKDLVIEKAAEVLCSSLSDQSFSTIHTRRGHDLEPEARGIYELQTGSTVLEVGFCELDKNTGCSPDGLVGEDGMIEIKCLDSKEFVKRVLNQLIKPIYKTQMQFNMLVTGRMWCDYVLYNPNFDNKCIHITRVFRDEEDIAEIRQILGACIKEMNRYIKQFRL